MIETMAVRQRGLVTLRQLGRAGAGDADIRRAVRVGQLWRLRNGVYATNEPDGSFTERVASACLHNSVAPIVASGLTAAHLWGLWSEPDVIEVSVRYPAHLRRGPDVRVHRSRSLTTADKTMVEGIPTTTPERTLVDLGRVLPEPEVLRIVEHAVATGAANRGRLWEVRRRVGVQGRNGAGVIDRALTALHDSIDLTESGPEAGLLRVLEAFHLPAPQPQHWVRAGGRRFRLDLAYIDAMLALEYDGAAWHASDEQRRADQERDALLTVAGWTVIRVRAADLKPPRDSELADQVRRALRARSLVL